MLSHIWGVKMPVLYAFHCVEKVRLFKVYFEVIFKERKENGT
jgi:hypothetical protein